MGSPPVVSDKEVHPTRRESTPGEERCSRSENRSLRPPFPGTLPRTWPPALEPHHRKRPWLSFPGRSAVARIADELLSTFDGDGAIVLQGLERRILSFVDLGQLVGLRHPAQF